ncbi:SMP-30/gluconolactonase/LRE family protein [Rhizobium halophilum]|uniref:SMP-30/gluconolactonase/LRE family protein n=1 Tax=Rhizobium halophilum TaxID=2846852 RepID=UPI001EFD9BFF|nr:SMP-30/gluconolactonase/LRE family protein [Rhizobium halophilum]MCF6369777.1 SMP-30/gluconolactonase/LRE family protein [Rhizobium halophilum]
MAAEPSHQSQILSSTVCELGEGPSFELETETLWWFDILGKTLHELHVPSRAARAHRLPFMASVVARIDDERQLLATEEGLFIRDRASGELSLYCELETDEPDNRSNDGRVHPSGSLWIGTMGKDAEEGAGAIYHVAEAKPTLLFENVSIPNSICFSPDGTTGYFVDTRINHLMHVPLDPATGLPREPALVLADTSARPGGMDGSVCDSRGNIWNARWGAGTVDCYSAAGKLLASHVSLAKRTTCPAFYGVDLNRLALTSAWEGLSDTERREDPLAGQLFCLTPGVSGTPEASFKL